MDINEKKLSSFERLIMTEAEEKRDAVLKELADEKKLLLDAERTELEHAYQKTLNHELARIDKTVNESVTAHQTAQRKEFLSAREEYINKIFNALKQRVAEYIKTDHYKNTVSKKIESVLKDLSDDYFLIINDTDEVIKSLGYQYKITQEDLFGGCKIVDNKSNIQIDISNKSIMEKQRIDFLENHQLRL